MFETYNFIQFYHILVLFNITAQWIMNFHKSHFTVCISKKIFLFPCRISATKMTILSIFKALKDTSSLNIYNNIMWKVSVYKSRTFSNDFTNILQLLHGELLAETFGTKFETSKPYTNWRNGNNNRNIMFDIYKKKHWFKIISY